MRPDDAVLTAADVCQLAKVPQATLNALVTNGGLTPTSSGRGPGHHRLFRPLDAVAVAIGEAFRVAGCSTSWARAAVRFVANATPQSLEEYFGRGYTFLLPLPPNLGGGRLLPGGRHWEWPAEQVQPPDALDLEYQYRRVMQAVQELTPLRNVRGRNRGLVVNRREEK